MKSGSIVLIDDNKVESLLYKEALQHVDHEHPIMLFHDAITAFEYIAHHMMSIFLIVSDINMPRMNGIELLEKINSNRELKKKAIPFIFLTNSAAPAEIEHAYLLSAQGYFQKPFSIDELSEIFRSMISYWSLAENPRKQYN